MEHFATHSREELDRLHENLRVGTYRPQSVQRVWITKPGSNEKRPLGIPTVRDRVVQTALLHVLEPIYDATFSEHSYGFRHGRGCHHALERVEQLLKEGYVHVVDADLKSYFDTIPKSRLLARVAEKVSDQRVLRLVEQFLEQGVMDGLREWTPETGTPQGAVASPLLANIYLNPLDHLLDDAGFALVRYADDFVILCRTREDAERAWPWCTAGSWTTNWPCIRPKRRSWMHGPKVLTSWVSLPRRLAAAAVQEPPEIQGFGAAPNQTHERSRSVLHLCPAEFSDAGMVHVLSSLPLENIPGAGRLDTRAFASILRKRQKRRGRARGADHQRWPNAYFDEHGLYSLNAAHIRFVQSTRG